MTVFSGPYVRVNEAILREKSNNTDDPRHPFYRAMISSDSYEDYYLKVKGLTVQPATYHTRPVTAQMEIRYARTQMGWIADRDSP